MQKRVLMENKRKRNHIKTFYRGEKVYGKIPNNIERIYLSFRTWFLSSLLFNFRSRLIWHLSFYRCMEFIKAFLETPFLETSKLIRPNLVTRTSRSERKNDDVVSRRSSRPLICFAAHERNRTNFNCLRTCAVARDGGRAKSSREAEGSISESIFQPKVRERPPEIFFRIISKRLSTYPSIFLVFSSDFDIGFVCPTSPRVVLPFVRGPRAIGFSNAIRIRKAIVEHEITSASCRWLSRLPIDISSGQTLIDKSVNRVVDRPNISVFARPWEVITEGKYVLKYECIWI